MDQAQLERLSAELERLLDLPAGQRAAALVVIEDMELRRAVERALRRLDQVGPLDRKLPELPCLHEDAVDDDHLQPGEHLGPWRVGKPLGEGGMARVYLAERAIGPAQKVAIKVIRRELISPRLRGRFLREQQVVARLEHPGIARMVDAGVSDTGEPWLATEYVDGDSLLRWCTQRQLDIPARLRLFLRLLAAVQHAHQHLVVHRDIKPSNILVADGQPKLLDFGIARALDDDAPANITQTEFRVLTPDYAAPEQFTGEPVSTATDLYALGVVLYELLTGTRPRRPSARDGGVSITAPSQALASPGQLATGALRRNRRAQLRGDLDAIVLKALREAPADRFASAEAFARDIQAYLDGRPVQARHGDRWYRLRKFATRNRAAVAASMALVLALAAGVIGVAWQARVARAEAARANALAEESQAQLDYLGSLLQVLAPSTAEARELDRAKLIAEATRRARTELATEPRLLASVELSLGGVAQEAGAYTQAADLFDRAYERRSALFGRDSVEAAEALLESGRSRLLLAPPQPVESEKRLRRAVAILRAKAPRGESMVNALQSLAVTLGDQDDYPEAQALLTAAADICATPAVSREQCERVWLAQGSTYARLRRKPDAIRAYERALASRRARLGEAHADAVFVAASLARQYFDSGERERGLALLETAYVQQKRIYATPTQETLEVIGHLASMLAMDDQNARALPLRLEQLEMVRRLFGDSHPDVALSHANLGSLYYAEGRFSEAVEQQLRAHRIYSAYAGSDGGAALVVQGNLADALLQDGRARDALTHARNAAEGTEKVFGAESAHFAARLSLLGRAQGALGLTDAALRNLDRSIALYRKLQPDKPNADIVAATRARIVLAAGRAAEAETALREAVRRIDANPNRTQRAYWETYAYLVEAACANRARDCRQLRTTARNALATQSMPGIARQRIETALASTVST